MAALDPLGRDRRLPRVHRGVAARRRARSTVSAPTRLRQPRRRHRRVEQPAAVDGGQPEATTAATAPDPARRASASTSTASAVVGIEVGIALVVLDLDVDPRARAGVERLAERRDVVGRSRHGVSTMTRPSADTGVMVDDERRRRRSAERPAQRHRRRAATASSNAATVFSGANRDAPRWAMTSVTPRTVPLVKTRSVP